MTGRWRDSDATSVLGLLGPLLAVLVLALVVAVDLGAYGFAVARAQASADGAALAAAVAAHPEHRPRRDPIMAAREVALASGGSLIRCTCPRKAGATVEVVVRMPVGGLVISRWWARSVDAHAAATTFWEGQ